VDGNCDVYLTSNYVVSPRDTHESYKNHRPSSDIPPHGDKLYPYEETNSGELDEPKHPRNIEDFDEGKAGEASKAVVGLKRNGEDGVATASAGGCDTKADKKSLKRAAEDELIKEVKPASEDWGDAEKKLSKKQLKKLKANNGKAVEATTDPKDKEARSTECSESSASRVLEGMTITDVKVGTGRMATKGANLYVYYKGRIEGGVVFDDHMDGLPFVFVLGGGEVIRGWEIGLLGMRVGGERRLDIPPVLCSGEDEEIPGAPVDAHWVYDGTFFSPLISPKC